MHTKRNQQAVLCKSNPHANPLAAAHRKPQQLHGDKARQPICAAACAASLEITACQSCGRSTPSSALQHHRQQQSIDWVVRLTSTAFGSLRPRTTVNNLLRLCAHLHAPPHLHAVLSTAAATFGTRLWRRTTGLILPLALLSAADRHPVVLVAQPARHLYYSPSGWDACTHTVSGCIRVCPCTSLRR